jgi:hydroxyacylglutathione hydrolase
MIALERDINPFLRSRQPAVIKAVQAHNALARDETAIFAALREWKNQFR